MGIVFGGAALSAALVDHFLARSLAEIFPSVTLRPMPYLEAYFELIGEQWTELARGQRTDVASAVIMDLCGAFLDIVAWCMLAVAYADIFGLPGSSSGSGHEARGEG